ncbi:MAG TPA: hypothetical protein ENN17_10585 [bacterium]|nr:hypothetical protein [bacterium]
MKKTMIILFLCLIPRILPGVPRLGGIGLLYVQSARTLEKGYLEFSGGTRYFGKIASFGEGRKAYTLWNVQLYSAFNYGVNEHIELAVAPILYQDTNRGKGGRYSKEAINVPDDLFLTAKFGSYGTLGSPYVYGIQLFLRFPTANQHNIIYEPYSAGRVGLGLNALLSYYSNTSFPDDGWSAHANLGYVNHNDVGADLTEEKTDPSPNAMSSEIVFAAGVLFPADAFDFSIELTAGAFLTRPPETAYSREYVSYITPAVYYKPYRWLTIQAGLDIRLFSGIDLTEYATGGKTHLPPPPTEDFPNYPGWRGVLGLKINILPKSLYASDEAEIRRRSAERRRLMEQMMQEQEDTDAAEQELNRIQSERRKVEEELERLRKLLDSEKQKNQ